ASISGRLVNKRGHRWSNRHSTSSSGSYRRRNEPTVRVPLVARWSLARDRGRLAMDATARRSIARRTAAAELSSAPSRSAMVRRSTVKPSLLGSREADLFRAELPPHTAPVSLLPRAELRSVVATLDVSRFRSVAVEERLMAQRERERAATNPLCCWLHERAALIHERAAVLHDRMADLCEARL